MERERGLANGLLFQPNSVFFLYTINLADLAVNHGKTWYAFDYLASGER